MTHHHIAFDQSTYGHMFRARCSCGWWSISNSQLRVELEASCHDLDQPQAPAHPHDDMLRALADAGYMPHHEYVRQHDDTAQGDLFAEAAE